MNIERYAARLVPLDLQIVMQGASASHPLAPIFATGGLVFPYSPSVSETVSIRYPSSGELIHSNENFHVYAGTDNRTLSIANAIWTSDTQENALYALAVVEFFRSYSMMDFGKGQTGRPPSPMLFSAYGKYAYNQVPVLLTGYSFTWSNETDLIPVSTGQATTLPTSTPALFNQKITNAATQLNVNTNVAEDWSKPDNLTQLGKLNIPELPSNNFTSKPVDPSVAFKKINVSSVNSDTTLMPVKLEITGIQLTIQRSPAYWKKFNLSDYRAGKIQERENT